MRCRQASMPELPPQLSAASCCPVDVTEASRLREDRTAVMTREPGDLPRPRLRPRAGCPGGRLLGMAFRHSALRHASARPLPQRSLGLPMSVTREAKGAGPPLTVPTNSPAKQLSVDFDFGFSERHKLSVPKTTQPLRIAWIDAARAGSMSSSGTARVRALAVQLDRCWTRILRAVYFWNARDQPVLPSPVDASRRRLPKMVRAHAGHSRCVLSPGHSGAVGRHPSAASPACRRATGSP